MPEFRDQVRDLPKRFVFSHPELRRPGCGFVRGDNRAVILAQRFGDLQAATELTALTNSLNLPPQHPDFVLLQLVPHALLYQRRIESGDPIPSELCDGRPSWQPKEAAMQRSVSALWRGLQLSFPEPVPERAGTAIEPAAMLQRTAQLVRHLLPELSVAMVERRLNDAVAEMARVDWLRRATTAVQRTVGEMAQFSARHQTDTAGDLAKRTALQLRQVAIWGTERAMRCDAAIADTTRLLKQPEQVAHHAWPQINMLRAFALDVEAVLLRWQQAVARSEGPRLRDVEEVQRLVYQRYARFDPTIFMPPERPATWQGDADDVRR